MSYLNVSYRFFSEISVKHVNNDSKMVGELVKRDGHVASDAEHKELRNMVQKRRESVKLWD